MKTEKKKRFEKVMHADDLFVEGLKQVFSVRTGEFLGYTGEKHLEEVLPDEEVEQIAINQLTIF